MDGADAQRAEAQLGLGGGFEIGAAAAEVVVGAAQPAALAAQLGDRVAARARGGLEQRVGLRAPAQPPQRQRVHRDPLDPEQRVRREAFGALGPLHDRVVAQVDQRVEGVAVRDQRRQLGIGGRIAAAPGRREQRRRALDVAGGQGEARQGRVAPRTGRRSRDLAGVRARQREIAGQQHPVDRPQQPRVALLRPDAQPAGADQRRRRRRPPHGRALGEGLEVRGQDGVRTRGGRGAVPQRGRVVARQLRARRGAPAPAGPRPARPAPTRPAAGARSAGRAARPSAEGPRRRPLPARRTAPRRRPAPRPRRTRRPPRASRGRAPRRPRPARARPPSRRPGGAR